MPDWRDNEVKDNIRDGQIRSSNLDIDGSNKKSRLELERNLSPINDLTAGDHKTTNNNGFGFGVITNKPLENGTASMARRSLQENGENDLAYYDWPAIDNFEDVDRLFRNCDSTFGQSEAMEDGGEELSWFATSSDAMYTSEMEALNNFAAYSSSCKQGPQTCDDAEVEDAFAPTSPNVMECEGEEIEEVAANQKLTYNGYGALDMDMTGNPHLSVQSMTQDLADQNQKQKQQVEPGSSSYLTFDSYPGKDGIESPPAHKGIPSAVRRKTEKLKNEKPSFEFERGTNCNNDKSKSILDSSMVVNGSSNNNSSSAFSTNDLSVEETSFMELQDVMNQLDVKTKLCIRDSLYRLARSVQQRNDFDSSPASSSYGNVDAQYSAINNGFAEPINPETGTNPIDRSIAELLFHQKH
ncbi:dentin sialophosphoprotein-like protein isoform X2 [Carex rostrata]